MLKNNPVVLGLLIASMASVIYMNDRIITNTAAQSVDSSSKAACIQGIVVRDLPMISREKIIPATNHVYLDRTRHYISALNNKGLALEKIGNNTEAIFYYKKALAIQPNDTDTLDNIGMALTNQGNYTEAILYFDKALAIDPHYISALNNKGLALEKIGNNTEAIFYYKKALAIQPNDTDTLDNIGMALTNQGNYTGAIEYYNRALAINPNDETALYNKGNAFDHLGFPSF